MIKNKRYPHGGFTLIELLVVVLIIGILAAIALPQYQKAVAKAELSQLLNAVTAYAQSFRNYYLVNGTMKTELKNLDIEINDKNIECSTSSHNEEGMAYLLCNSKRFAIWAYVYPNKTGVFNIGTNTTKENSAFTYTIKDYFGENMGNCYIGADSSSICQSLGVKNCFSCAGTKYI